MERLHFIAGLPRSGSTLLCNILMQNPRFYASATSGLVEVLRGIRDGWDNVAAFRAMTPEESRRRELDTLRGALRGYYAGVDRPVVFDKSRAWPAYIEMLKMVLGGPVRMLVCVRDMRDVLASFEKLYRRTAALGLPTQARAEPAAFATLEARCDLWVRADQPLGAAYNMVRDAIQRGHGSKMHMVRYEELTAHPVQTLAGIYAFLDEEPFTHDFDRVAQVTWEDDREHGFRGLHDIRPAVRAQPAQWPTVLGKVAERYQGQELW